MAVLRRRSFRLVGGSAVARPVFAALLGLLFAATSGARVANGVWARTAQPPAFIQDVPARAGHSLVVDARRNELMAYGGTSVEARVWSIALTPMSPWIPSGLGGLQGPGTWGHSAGFDSTTACMIVFGGAKSYSDGYAVPLNSTYTFHWTHGWVLLTPSSSPPAREFAASIFDPIGRRLIVFGGNSGPIFANDLWTFTVGSATSGTWNSVVQTGARPSPRTLAMTAYDSARHRMIVHGGWNGPHLADTWALDLTTLQWTPIATANRPPARRGGVAAYDPTGDRFVIFGGYDGSARGDVWQLQLSGTPDWSPVVAAGNPPSPRIIAASTYERSGDRMFVMGGYDTHYRSDLHELSLGAAPAWTATPVLSQDQRPHIEVTDRYSTALRPARRELYLYAGAGTGQQLWRLGLGDAVPYWQPVSSPAPGPNVRRGQRAVWDLVRDRMILFGGNTGSVTSNEVWIMTPDPPTWRKLETSGTPPDPREYCGLAFDPFRDRLLVVAGSRWLGVGDHLGDVWELPFSGPTAGTWSEVPTAGTPPSPRAIFDMRLDPSRDRVVFFGGIPGPGLTDETWTLSLSEPSTWTRLLPEGLLPIARAHHAMAHDPARDRMIVFGGESSLGTRGDVFELSLAGSPKWTRLSPQGATPSARKGIEGQFDIEGDRFVFFGGMGSLQETFNDTWLLQFGVPVSTLASLIAHSAAPDQVHLEWAVPNAPAFETWVERSNDGLAWEWRGAGNHSGGDRIEFDDHEIESGRRYWYRLALSRGDEMNYTEEVEVEVPAGFSLELTGAQPNPGVGRRLPVAFSLSRQSRASLELIDISGRRVASRDLSGFSPGQHRVDLGEGAALEPGVYVIRLAAEGRWMTKKALIVR